MEGMLKLCGLLTVLFVISTANVQERMEKRCRQYAESVFETVDDPILLPGARPKRRDTCGISTQTTIVGGEKANPREFPHMALVGYRGRTKTIWGCGSSLISEQWVVSAAHCIATPHGIAKFVLLGELDINSTGDEEKRNSRPEEFRIVRTVKHPGYAEPQAYNDIALFKMDRPVRFNRFIRPICLHSPQSFDEFVIASGFGATSFESLGSSHLLKAALEIVDNDECRRRYPISANAIRQVLANGVSNETHICAGAPGKDTCQGDSGGPLQQVLSDPYCMYTLVGVTSLGARCSTRRPGIFIRVQHYLPWIETIVWPEAAKPDKIHVTTTSNSQTISNPVKYPLEIGTTTQTAPRIPIAPTSSSSIVWPDS